MKKSMAIGLSAAALASGCGGEGESLPTFTDEVGRTIGVLLLAKTDAVIFKEPNQTDTEIGVIKPDDDVIARCYYDSPPNHDDMVFVDASGQDGRTDGYVYVLGRQGSKDTDPYQVFDYSPEEIKESLPSCDESSLDD